MKKKFAQKKVLVNAVANNEQMIIIKGITADRIKSFIEDYSFRDAGILNE